jgi:hypothetical protein
MVSFVGIGVIVFVGIRVGVEVFVGFTVFCGVIEMDKVDVCVGEEVGISVGVEVGLVGDNSVSIFPGLYGIKIHINSTNAITIIIFKIQ